MDQFVELANQFYKSMYQFIKVSNQFNKSMDWFVMSSLWFKSSNNFGKVHQFKPAVERGGSVRQFEQVI